MRFVLLQNQVNGFSKFSSLSSPLSSSQIYYLYSALKSFISLSARFSVVLRSYLVIVFFALVSIANVTTCIKRVSYIQTLVMVLIYLILQIISLKFPDINDHLLFGHLLSSFRTLILVISN